ncbi:MAG: alkaline phosphatase [Solirubrobacterales bacterium]|nr:alkaline phosphatase [Solirubrobacterales bacterium]
MPHLDHLITAIVAGWGALGVFALMVPESAGLVVPSEIVLLLAGVSVSRGRMDIVTAMVAGTAGNVVGSLALYWVGTRTVGRPPRAGSKAARALARCDALLVRHGASRAVFLARLMPLARSFVSLPAGRVRVPLVRFTILTTAGCALWAIAFVGAGALAGDTYGRIGSGVRDVTVVVLAAFAAAWVVRRRRRTGRAERIS